MNIARTTLSSKLLNVEKDHFARLAVDAVLRLKVGLSLCGSVKPGYHLPTPNSPSSFAPTHPRTRPWHGVASQGSGNLDYIQLIKKPGGSLSDSFLEEGFVLNKSFGIGQVPPPPPPTHLPAPCHRHCLTASDRLLHSIVFSSLDGLRTPRS
jgi:T-complex protein 1 subunit beta